ncbi:MFS transporter [Streptomyces sp. WMMC500]|uniref:MFS transporter n=1 Tax=Streptomyces sp. WMMC500 TaxID=3015154 RepID=UPI00248C4671|nr:MFS transporter [Streptomyces sp. WMMC500]WBB61557.1 MFS transporter [Streptomyces sp. WMMC500]
MSSASDTSARPRLGLILALLAFAQFIIAIDFNIVIVAMPEIGAELGFSESSLQWVISAYLLGLGGLLMLSGRVADIVGQRRMFILGMAVYGVSSLAGGLATEPWMLVTARAAQGLGGAVLTPAILSLLTTTFAEGAERNRALGVWGVGGGAGLATGAMLGGVLTEWASWEAVFYVNVPLTLVGATVAAAVVPRGAARAGGTRLDLPGATLATGGSLLVVLGLVSGPEEGWATVRGAGALAAGAALFCAFLVVESRVADPLVPLRLLRNRSLLVGMGTLFLFLGALSGSYFVLTTYMQALLGFSALEAGLGFLPLSLLAAVAASVVAPRMLNRWGMRTTLVTSMGGIAAGMTGVGVVVAEDGSYWAMLPGMAVWSLAAYGFPAMFAAAAAGVAPHEQGTASGVANTASQIGGAVGLAIVVAVAGPGGAASPADAAAGLRDGFLVSAALMAAAVVVALALGKPPAAAGVAPVAASKTPDRQEV